MYSTNPKGRSVDNIDRLKKNGVYELKFGLNLSGHRPMTDLVNMDNTISGFIKCEYILCQQNNLSASEDVLCTLQQANDENELIKCHSRCFKEFF